MENRTSSWKMVQLVHTLVEMYLKIQATNPCIKFWISVFFLILWLLKCDKMAFFGKRQEIYPKITLFVHFGSCKIRKKPCIKNLILNFVANTLGYISTNLWTNWTIFQEQVRFSVKVFFPQFLPHQQKNLGFLAKNREILDRKS